MLIDVKFREKFLSIIMSLVMVLQFIIVLAMPTFAQNSMLDVDYDNCQKDLNGDGINEMWYILNFLKEGILI